MIQRSPACTGELPEGAKTSRVSSIKTVASARRVFSKNTSTHTHKPFAKLSLTAVRIQWSRRRGACPALVKPQRPAELSAVLLSRECDFAAITHCYTTALLPSCPGCYRSIGFSSFAIQLAETPSHIAESGLLRRTMTALGAVLALLLATGVSAAGTIHTQHSTLSTRTSLSRQTKN